MMGFFYFVVTIIVIATILTKYIHDTANQLETREVNQKFLFSLILSLIPGVNLITAIVVLLFGFGHHDKGHRLCS